ncbi:MAG: hypothetical protein HDQ96_05150 [Lachnospiraceae bacterium]|nr:hypothetical protein [Lachnospiraceae bacterium]
MIADFELPIGSADAWEIGEFRPDKVREVFALHDDKERRAKEAEIFINGYE